MTASPAIWQISAGPAERSYADVFLSYGVGLIGPGDCGPWRPGLEDERFEGGFVRRFASEMQVGDVVPISVLGTSDRHDAVLVSLKKGLAQRDWLRAERLLDSEEICEVEVAEANRGGVVVSFGQLRGFVPNSHLSSIRRGLSGERLDQAKAALVFPDITQEARRGAACSRM